MPKLIITWCVDSYGIESAHINGPGLSFKQSYLGHFVKVDSLWYFSRKTDADAELLGPYQNMGLARHSVMLYFGASYIE